MHHFTSLADTKLPPKCEIGKLCSLCRHARLTLHYNIKKSENNAFTLLRSRRKALYYSTVPNIIGSSLRNDLDDKHPHLKKVPTAWLPDVSWKIGRKWSLNVLELEDYGCDFPFMHIGFCLLAPLTVAQKTTTLRVLINFLTCLQSHYHDVSFHNSTHAGQVAHCFVAALNMLGHLESLDVMDRTAALVAALGHDVGHFGRTNAHLALIGDPLTLIYPESTLEYYHVFTTFNVLMAEGNNIFATLGRNEVMELRRFLVTLIVSTDMAKHFSQIREAWVVFQSKREPTLDTCTWYIDGIGGCRCVDCTKPDIAFGGESELNFNEDSWDNTYKMAILKACLKLADIGHSSLNWFEHHEWTRRTVIEFYENADEARHYNSDTMMRMDRSTQPAYYSNNKNFIGTMIIPLAYTLSLCARTNARRERFEKVVMLRLIHNESLWDELSGRLKEQVRCIMDKNDIYKDIRREEIIKQMFPKKEAMERPNKDGYASDASFDPAMEDGGALEEGGKRCYYFPPQEQGEKTLSFGKYNASPLW